MVMISSSTLILFSQISVKVCHLDVIQTNRQMNEPWFFGPLEQDPFCVQDRRSLPPVSSALELLSMTDSNACLYRIRHSPRQRRISTLQHF